MQIDHEAARSLAVLPCFSYVHLSGVRLTLVTQYSLPLADILASQAKSRAKSPAFFHLNLSCWIGRMVGWDNYQFFGQALLTVPFGDFQGHVA
jgi:hypothetical protein